MCSSASKDVYSVRITGAFSEMILTFTVLSAALLLLFCAGWVHRDVSCGNVLLWRDRTGKLYGKLGDLEYAKKFPSAGSSPDPKTVSHVNPCDKLPYV